MLAIRSFFGEIGGGGGGLKVVIFCACLQNTQKNSSQKIPNQVSIIQLIEYKNDCIVW